MAKPGRITQEKRGRERAKQEKRQDKIARRSQRKEEKDSRPESDNNEDPDLAGIYPGPQPVQED
ncbi:MAG TPA: hypothetical protein DCS07_17895 [Bdellovibrionales bacterium]|nr:MAG: hypothetical protein A2Z97_05380 [Bdellovibrionales bacterium GWB1_52_6]OFZ05703.1 MAG: hypothetical protein A2X97_03285 [Bdellovibrionales bacterium GWA1_52_35]OFZ40653.1 MAG: hypothetical protein A2070_06295 [Bdellovibrionales bacterium GWC1_52_8]HAR44475.1 hypothetical protein [Bdellovibrionales bacterium]HCM40361.1 hypothetical protein [Bdellovibrionales bacterium]